MVEIGVDVHQLGAKFLEAFAADGAVVSPQVPTVLSGSLDQNTTIWAFLRQSSTVEYQSAMPFFMVWPK